MTETPTDWQNVAAALNSQLAAEQSKLAIEHEARLAVVDELAAEREVGHNTAVALAQQIIKLEDQLATLVDALKRLRYCRCNDVVNGKHNPDCNVAIIDAALKITDQPVQLPTINDDPVVTLK